MAKVDLNIVDRGTDGTEWIAQETGLTAANLDDVLEQKTDNASALNSLPTPFARFFVAREAFRRVNEEYLSSGNTQKEAGFAYRQIVSDILDVYELLFNLKYHKNNTWTNEKIDIIEWDSKANLSAMKSQMPILYNSLNDYYASDVKEEKLYFVVYTENGKSKLLACSSPYTGFVTPPDLDKSSVKKDGTTNQIFAGEQYSDLHIHRKSGGEYFRDAKMLEDRDADFKNYMYNVLFSSDELDGNFKTINEYVRSFKNDKDIRNDYKSHTIPVKTDQNDDLVINGLLIRSSDEIDVDSYFTPYLIKVPYRISRDEYAAVVYQNDVAERDYDFLLPFKPEVLSLFNGEMPDTDIHINRNSITVNLRYNGKTYKKEYAEEPFTAGMGTILNLGAAHINFDLGLFPNILSYKEAENNYFKVMVVAADEDKEAPNFNIGDGISLNFFKNESGSISQIKELDPESTGANYCVLKAVVRSRQKSDDVDGGTKFYELYHTAFDAIQVNVMGHTGLLIRKWQKSKPTNETFTYSVDLGTSNTFISRCKNGENNKPEMFKMDKPMVSWLHESPSDSQFSLVKRIEGAVFEQAKNRVKTEFLPAMIDGFDYKFPIRTALCGINNNDDTPKLFDNKNIAFFYEKMMADEGQDVKTDIKWDRNDALLRIFIQELLLIIKCDILQRNGDLDKTRLIWFRPLSFMGMTRSIYNEIWTEEPKRILSVQQSQVSCFSESEAPYYYFKKMDYIKNSDAVSVIDIGGGSTDFVYFEDNRPVVANSVHFGCDVLWENGFTEFDNARENGIYNRYAETLRFRRDDLEELNECFKNVDKAKTKDIINFWLSNSDYCDIKRNLNMDFKPVFVYHLTAILYYMASMYKDNGYMAPKTIVFSGNGSRYIDNFICTERSVLKKIIDLVFSRVYGGEHDVNLKLPEERKESTCYGGLYRDPNAEDVPEKVYQGDIVGCYEKIEDIDKNFSILKGKLADKYKEMAELYKDILDLLKKEHIIDNTADTSSYVELAYQDMLTPLNTYYKTQIKDKYSKEVELRDSVFFLPVIDRVFNMTKL